MARGAAPDAPLHEPMRAQPAYAMVVPPPSSGGPTGLAQGEGGPGPPAEWQEEWDEWEEEWDEWGAADARERGGGSPTWERGGGSPHVTCGATHARAGGGGGGDDSDAWSAEGEWVLGACFGSAPAPAAAASASPPPQRLRLAALIEPDSPDPADRAASLFARGSEAVLQSGAPAQPFDGPAAPRALLAEPPEPDSPDDSERRRVAGNPLRSLRAAAAATGGSGASGGRVGGSSSSQESGPWSAAAGAGAASQGGSDSEGPAARNPPGRGSVKGSKAGSSSGGSAALSSRMRAALAREAEKGANVSVEAEVLLPSPESVAPVQPFDAAIRRSHSSESEGPASVSTWVSSYGSGRAAAAAAARAGPRLPTAPSWTEERSEASDALDSSDGPASVPGSGTKRRTKHDSFEWDGSEDAEGLAVLRRVFENSEARAPPPPPPQYTTPCFQRTSDRLALTPAAGRS